MDFLSKVIFIYYLVVNIVAFALMGIDKRKAIKDKWRIKEHTLFLTAAIGGFVGYYIGMHTFHHKTKKMAFHICFYVSLVVHCVFLYFYIF